MTTAEDAAVSAERQIQLSLKKTVRIAWNNIRVRWWRSMLVTFGIILALAFLVYVSFSDALQSNIQAHGSSELISELRSAGDLAADDLDSTIQTRWMVGLALLISFVGILNAMVLNVTERFREIGTMKCLGALDSLVIKIYLIESAFQGVGGTLIGILLGALLAIAEGWSLYGGETLTIVPFETVWRILAMSLTAGIVLSIGGALYPAWIAAKMEPVDAMGREI
ncbi:MAG: FtsX-like permease family protein [Desulfobacterales bacterium]